MCLLVPPLHYVCEIVHIVCRAIGPFSLLYNILLYEYTITYCFSVDSLALEPLLLTWLRTCVVPHSFYVSAVSPGP